MPDTARDSKFLREGFVTFVKSNAKALLTASPSKMHDPKEWQAILTGFALLAGVAVRLCEPDKAPLRELMSRRYAAYHLPYTAPLIPMPAHNENSSPHHAAPPPLL